MSFEERYSRLNEEQKHAVDTIEGPVLVVAGPGSGKTELLSMRAANILRKSDALPSSILCITYTEAASENMRQRLLKLIGKDSYKIFISTFHGLGSFIINHYPEYFYNGAKMDPMDDISRFEIMNKILSEMDLKNKLNTKHPSQGFTYLKDINSAIGNLKDAGISPEEFKKIVETNLDFLQKADPIISQLYSEKITKDTIPKFEKALTEIMAIPYNKEEKNKHIKPIAEKIIELMLEAKELIPTEKTKPITKLKDKLCSKDDENNFKLKDLLNYKKQIELAEIYEKYRIECEERGLYDYSDMIMETIKVIERNPALHYDLAERFQYIMVDEFQDTNGAQMRLLECIIDEEVTEGRPNILAVGDDDQAIYKFQGAKIENIMSFHKKYRDPSVIVLTKNYRSHQNILDNIRKVILQGESRLENQADLKIDKSLTQASSIKEGEFDFNAYSSKQEEFRMITEKVKELISTGTPQNEISVLMRRNKDLEALAKVLDMAGIRVSYEKQKNILEDSHIIELLNLLKYINSIANKSLFEADEVLPEILSAPFLNIPSIEIWKLSRSIRSNEFWLSKMAESENPEIKKLSEFFIELAKISKVESAETIIDYILGNKSLKIGESEYLSLYKEFYFSDAEFENNRKLYLERLKSIQEIISKIRSYKKKENLKLADLVKFIRMHEENGIPINSINRHIDEKALNLITIHSSKGLEFDTIFLAGLSESEWKKSGFCKLKFPLNLSISKDDEDDDDMIRLLYVGMSRAKRNLYLSYSSNGERSKKSRHISPLCEFEANELFSKEDDLGIITSQKINSHLIFNTDENAFLRNILQNYKLSVTHLKNFLDLENGGPHLFVRKNLLRFPEKKNSFAEYGTSAHEAIEATHKQGKMYGTMPEREFMIKEFEKILSQKRITRADFDLYLEKGKHDLSHFYEQNLKLINPADFTEFDFQKEDIIVNDVKIKGQIDRIHVLENKEIEVVDYKTGRPFSSWEAMKRSKPSKYWHYEMQLYYYKILIENSRKFSGNFSVKSGQFDFIEASKDDNKIFSLKMYYEREKEERIKKLMKIVWDMIQNLEFPDTEFYGTTFAGTKAFEEDLLARHS